MQQSISVTELEVRVSIVRRQRTTSCIVLWLSRSCYYRLCRTKVTSCAFYKRVRTFI